MAKNNVELLPVVRDENGEKYVRDIKMDF